MDFDNDKNKSEYISRLILEGKNSNCISRKVDKS